MRSVEGDLQPCLIYIDKEGRWFHKGVEMVRREFVQSFYQQMEMDAAGHYIISWGGERCYVDVEDTAFVVKRVSPPGETGGKGTGFKIRLSDDTEEELMPDTLYLGESNVLYCKVKEGNFPARFNRAAYYQLAAYVEPGEEGYVLPVNGRKFTIGSKDV
ncbi:MAG: DUF1285 domain-containing protein [Deltaproteobacteria bacterium]|nr:DUF1285 domain-containing protein [Deltaproteobacteria bacterium]